MRFVVVVVVVFCCCCFVSLFVCVFLSFRDGGDDVSVEFLFLCV